MKIRALYLAAALFSCGPAAPGIDGGNAAGGGSATAGGGNATAGGGNATAGGGSATAGGGSATAGGGNATAGGGPAPLFFDDFEYTADRSSSNVTSTFVARGWAHTKAENALNGGGGGYLYTLSSGPCAATPGSGSRALMIESRPTMYPPPMGFPYSQTDFYLQYGAEVGAADTLPPDLWFQFWMRIVDEPGRSSRFHSRNKLVYPTSSNPPYPSTDLRWLFMNGAQGFEQGPATPGNNFLALEAYEADYTGDAEYPTNRRKLFQNRSSQQIVANQWTLVKVHVDTSGAQGRYEAWLRPQGAGWTKISEWFGGVTPQFTWPLTPAQRVGHRSMRLPTTVNSLDNWVCLDDFTLATSEAALPRYP
ncbi:MAG: hypothetical protein JNK82_25390 [Myxococcaceae bacterium]|nr:hypothetical protein [Myxococcaceae bacterium]